MKNQEYLSKKTELVEYFNDYYFPSSFFRRYYHYCARYFLFYNTCWWSQNSLHDLYSNYKRTWYIIRYEREKSEEVNLVRHKTRNSETENVSRRTTIIIRHKSFVPQFFCRLDNGLPGFTVKPVAGDYDIKYLVLASTWSRWYVMSSLERRLSRIGLPPVL